MTTHSANIKPVAGPLWAPAQTCTWCGDTIGHRYIDGRYDRYVAADGTMRCSPAARGVKPGQPGHCRFGYYNDPAVMGTDRTFDPLTLSFHSPVCDCNLSRPHTPSTDASDVYPWPSEVPWHCDQPMQMRIYHQPADDLRGAWHCRKHDCSTTVAPRPTVEELPAAA